jgi:hypothetical protein
MLLSAAPSMAQNCIDDVTARTNNCTANDVDLEAFQITGIIDGCSSAADTARITARMLVIATSANRWDVGFFLANDGGSARTGQCYRGSVPPPLEADTVDVQPLSGQGPYLNEDGDLCGDLEGKVPNVLDLVHHYQTVNDPAYGPVDGILEFPCTDVNANGLLDAGWCLSWDNNVLDAGCLGPGDTAPSTKSKCRCSRLDVDIPIPSASATLGVLPGVAYLDCETPGAQRDMRYVIQAGECAGTFTVTSMTSDVFGSLDGVGDCSFPQTMSGGASYACTAAADMSPYDNRDTVESEVTMVGDCDGTPVVRTATNTLICTDEPGCTGNANCADGDLCTGLEICDIPPGETSGVCVSGAPLDCDDGDACTTDSCDAILGCLHETIVCDDGNGCTADSCDSVAGCLYSGAAMDGSACDDGDVCTDSDECTAGVCAGSARDCSAAGDQCNDGVCNAATGACEAAPVADGSACDDGDVCTAPDSCLGGSCVAGAAVDCDDLNPCTVDSCDAVLGCMHDGSAGTCGADLSISCLDGPDSIPSGDLLGYSATVVNHGPGTATDAEATLVFDASVTVEQTPAGCSVAADGRTVTCALGDLDAGQMRRLQFLAMVDPAAPTGAEGTNPPCGANGDICLQCSVATTTVDVDPANNAAEQPSNVIAMGAAVATCGDGIVDPGEECDEPGAEDCANGLDDDGDGWTDWGDSDCDCSPGAPPACTRDCTLVLAPMALLKDPQRIRYCDGRPDAFRMHASVESGEPIDPEAEGAFLRVSDSQGTIFYSRLYPGDLRRTPWGWLYSNRGPDARDGSRGGVVVFRIKDRARSGGPYIYPVNIVIRAEFAPTTESWLTTDIGVGRQTSRLYAEWAGTPGRSMKLMDAAITDKDPCLNIESAPASLP